MMTQLHKTAQVLVLCMVWVFFVQCAQSGLKKEDQTTEALKPPGGFERKLAQIPGEKHLQNLRQVTLDAIDDRLNWSYDGDWITFQRQELAPGSPNGSLGLNCHQVYKVRSDGADLQRITSTRNGALDPTFLPEDRRIMFTGSQSQKPICLPSAEENLKRPEWPILASQQILSIRTDGTDLLPVEPGAPTTFHSEAATCQDKSVIFSSDQEGYIELFGGKLDDLGTLSETQKVMSSSGSGFNGSASFSPDCQKIVWVAGIPDNGKEPLPAKKRAQGYSINPGTLEIWSANSDGTNPHPITNLGAKSFSPTFSPRGDKIFFASNFTDPASPKSGEFAIYRINLDGTGLEQITTGSSYESSPRFSRDGTRFAFVSQRNSKVPQETSIFIGEWLE